MATRPRLLIALANLILLLLLLATGARVWAGTPTPAAIQPGDLDVLSYGIAQRDTGGSNLARMACVWEQLDIPEPEPAPPQPTAPSPSTPRGQLIAVSPQSCIVEDTQGRQHSLSVGDNWGDYQVAAIHLDRRAVGVVGTLELQHQGQRSKLELLRE